MPYVSCDHCDTTAYTAARFTTVDYCPLCGERLPQASVRFPVPSNQWAAIGSAGVREPAVTPNMSAASAP